jgi:hypothetical protein
MGDCHRCGIQLLQMYLEELHTNRKTQWQSIGHEVIGRTIE